MIGSDSGDVWYKSTCHIDQSLWGATAKRIPNLQVLKSDIKTDVAVIGAGFCGLSTALHLSEGGFNVSIVDAHEPGWGASGRNGGQIIPGLKIMPNEIERRFGKERGRQIIETASSAPSLVYELIDRYGIDCDLKTNGWIQLAKGPEGSKTINSHLNQWRNRDVNVRALNKGDIERLVGTSVYQRGLLDSRGGNLHPLKYARGLAKACITNGVSIFHDSPALAIENMEGKWLVKTNEGSISAEIVVVCTNAYTGNMLPTLSQSIVPVLTGVVATDPLPEELNTKILPERQTVADTRRLLSWFGFDAMNRLVFGSRTNSQIESIDVTNFTFGIRRLHEIFPQTKGLNLKYIWTGRVALTLDHVPHIHKLADGLYSGLGFNGRGVAMATTFGKILARHAQGKIEDNEFLPLSPVKKVSFNRFKGGGIAIALTWKRMMDTLRP